MEDHPDIESTSCSSAAASDTTSTNDDGDLTDAEQNKSGDKVNQATANGGGSASSRETPGSDNARQYASKKRRLCSRLSTAGGRGRWVIAGPVHDHDDVNPFRFSVAILVESLPTFTSREVYARAVPMLVQKGVYSSLAAAYPSMQHVTAEPDSSTTLSQDEPSWTVADDAEVPVRRVLDRAAEAVKRSGNLVAKGFVKFVAFLPLTSHPWYAYATRLRRRRDQRRGALAYKRGLGVMTDDDERRLLRAANCTSLLAVRHSTTYRVRSPAERTQGLRAIKKRPWRGISAPAVIPARKRLVVMKRRVFEKSARVGHAMVTMREDDTAEVWTYIGGSGLLGVRLYKSSDGTVKRLACPSHKQRRTGLPAGGATTRTPRPADSVEQRAPDVPGVARAAGSTEPGLLAAASWSAVAQGGGRLDYAGVGEVFGHDSPLSDGGGPPSADRVDGRLTPEELRILKCSTLEDLDGTCPLVVVAVQFDVVAAVSAAIAQRAKQCTVADCGSTRVAWSMGSDGGPVRHSAITLFTLTLSAPWLYKGRTAMLPVMYILAGEHHLHTALGDRLDALLTEAVCATYDIPVHTGNDENDAVDNGNRMSDASGGDAGQQRFYAWTGPRLVRIVGDFSMLAHIMGLTGGSDDSRCPFWWPCMPRGFLSIGAHASVRGRTRTVHDIGKQWELVCWELARWIMLKNGAVFLDKGTVAVSCDQCDALSPLLSPLAADFRCRVPACRGQTRAFRPILPTPLKVMFNLLRRRAGGVRGYPVIRSVPVLLQVPVLHCTGSIMKKVTYLFLSELGEAHKSVAKHGMYAVTGRANMGDLYLREHIKLVALILACEDLVGVSVDPAVMTMWSLTLMLSAAWRQTLTGRMEHREKYLHVLELTAGLLAPLWAAIKPLDKEKKGSGVASLYLHAALVHARESLGANSPAEAVITDDHVEGTIRDMGRHCGTRVNNVSRAQAVTEFQALATDEAATLHRNSFAAELVWYTERIDLCACCTTELNAAQADDIVEAVKRADAGDVIVAVAGENEEAVPASLRMPDCLVFRPEDAEAPANAGDGKETRIARALGERLRVLTVCICGAGWGRPMGSFGERLATLREQARGSSPANVHRKLDCGTHFDKGGDASCRTSKPYVPQRPKAGSAGVHADDNAAGAIPREDARMWMVRHTAVCRARQGECDGACVDSDDIGPADVDGAVWGDDVVDRDALDGGDECDDEEGPAGAAENADVDQDQVPFLASTVVADADLSEYAPPAELLHAVLGDDEYHFKGDAVDAVQCHDRLAEEDMLLRIFLLRMREPPFVRWTKTSNVRLSDVHCAVMSVLQRLAHVRMSLPGAVVTTL